MRTMNQSCSSSTTITSYLDEAMSRSRDPEDLKRMAQRDSGAPA